MLEEALDVREIIFRSWLNGGVKQGVELNEYKERMG